MALKLLRIFIIIISFFFLTGFISVFSILGPSVTAITSGNLYKAGAQFIINQSIEKETGKNSLTFIKEEINKNLIKEDEDNLKLLSSSYFYARDLDNGIKTLIKAEKISDDPELSFRLGTYAFDSEQYKLAISSFDIAKKRGWNDMPGRIELIKGISYFELDDVEKAKANLILATNYEDTKDTAEGWLSYIAQF